MGLCEFLCADGRVVGIASHYVIAVLPADPLPRSRRKADAAVQCATVVCAGNRTFTVIGSQKSVTAKIARGD